MLKPLKTYRKISLAACILLFIAFLFFLLVGTSLTIIKPIFLLDFRSILPEGVPQTSIATELRFGVWGVCATGAFNPPTPFENRGTCFGPQLGYEIPQDIISLTTLPPIIITTIQKTLLVILILHPISAGLTFVTFLSSLFLSSHAFSIFTLILTIVTALVSSIVLGVDLALVIVARIQVRRLEESIGLRFDVDFGNGVWLVLSAVVLIWVSLVLLSARACYCCGVRRQGKDVKA